jgi:hypothetical protein
MAKKDLSKILKEGSVRQRLRLLDDQRAGIVYGKSSALTAKEMDELIESFKTPEEIKLYNLHLRAFRYFRELLMGLEAVFGTYKEALAYITGFSLLWDSYERHEELINSVIYEVKDKKTKNVITKKFESNSLFLYADVVVDEEGFFRFHTDNRERKKRGKPRGDDYSLESILRLWKGRAEEYASQIKTGCKALMDYSEIINYKPGTFIEKLNQLVEYVETDHALIPKFSEKQMKEMEWASMELLDKYFVYPNPDKIEVNEVEYSNFMKVLKAHIENG